MKHKINIFGALALTGILLFAACSDLMNPPDISQGGETGKVIIRIGEGEERTLTPPSADLSNLHYNLVIKNNSSAVVYDDAVQGVFEYTLATGTYTLIVDAFNADDELVASRETNNVTVSPGQTTTAKIVLQPVANVDIPGYFHYSVTLPSADDIPYTSATLTLSAISPNSGDVTINLVDSPSSAEPGISLPPGRYTMTINVASPREVRGQPLSIFRRETVYIYSNLTTSTVDGAYVFTAVDFEAEVRFKGAAQVINAGSYTLNEDYIPKKVYIQLSGVHEDDPLGEAAIVQNTETGAYEWELALPSHYVTEGNLANAWFWFRAEHKAAATKVLYSPGASHSLTSSQGNININLQMNVAVPDLPTYITLENNLDVVPLGGQATAIITPPAKYGLIASRVYVDGSPVNPDIIDTSSGKIKITVTVPQSLNPAFSADFFHLKGTASAAANTDNFIAKSVAAYELDAEGNLIDIGTVAAVNATTNEWEITVPATYVFRGGLDNNVYFKVNFGLAAAGSPIVYTYDNRANTQTREQVTNLTGASDTVSLGSISLFQLTGVKAAIDTPTAIVISWDAADWATGYNVYSSLDSYTTPLNGATPVTGTSFRHNVTISDGTTYYYRVRGIRTGGILGPEFLTNVSKPSLSSVWAGPNTTTGGLFTSVIVSWSYVSSAAEYYVERRTNGGSWTHLTTTTSTSYSDSNVEMVDADYQYRVTARVVSGVSNPAADSTPQTSSTVSAPQTQSISWNSYGYYSIGSGETYIYRLSNYVYSSAYLYLGSNNGYTYFTWFDNRTKNTGIGYSASGTYFSLYRYFNGSYGYGDLILVVEGYGSDSYYININN